MAAKGLLLWVHVRLRVHGYASFIQPATVSVDLGQEQVMP